MALYSLRGSTSHGYSQEWKRGSDLIQFMMVFNMMYCNEAGMVWHVEEVSHWR